jgi:hypothetical protein
MRNERRGHLQIVNASRHSSLDLLKVHLILQPRLIDLDLMRPVVHTIHIRPSDSNQAYPYMLLRVVKSNISYLILDLTVSIKAVLKTRAIGRFQMGSPSAVNSAADTSG